MKRNITRLIRILAALTLPVAMLSTAQAADTSTPTALTAPSGLPGVAALPFTGFKSADFIVPEKMANLTFASDQGVVGDALLIKGAGLPSNSSLELTWGTFDGTWVTDVQPNTVNYMGVKYTKYNVNIATVTTDAAGTFSYSTKVPSDFGGVHDIYAISSGTAVAHGGYQLARSMSISPKSGPIGTPITISYNGMGASLYTAGASVLWDNHFAGEMQALWTRGTASVVIRAAGSVGSHELEVRDAITQAYLNIRQSPVPFANGGYASFRITKDAGAPAASITWPAQVEPTVSQRTTLSTVGLDPNTKAIASLSTNSGAVGSKTSLTVSGLTTTGDHQIVWASVVGNRVNCSGTCWAYTSVPLGNVNVSDGSIKQDVTIPDHLGGWHVIQVKQGDVIEAQVPFYVKESIMPFYDKSGKLLSMGIAKADPLPVPESRDGSGTPTNIFKVGDDVTISIKGVGWTQLDNTLAVTYDNSYIGYGCGFNSNGYMVVHFRASGAPGTHLIDLNPLLYTNQPSFANTPYGMAPILTSARDFPGLALGYQIPSFHFAITIVK